MGLAAGYHYGDVRPFVRSLEETGYAGQCVLFVTPTTRGLDEIAAHGVTVVPFERTGQLEHLPYNAVRFFLYRDFLATSERRYERILISDVRDVIFQSDPFGFAWPAGINVTLEDRHMTIGDCPYMTHWTGGHLGNEALQAIADKPISCSGTTVCCHDGMDAYIRLMLPMLELYTPAPRMAGYDQGVHNHLLHSGALAAAAPVTVHDNSGPVLTLGYYEGEPPFNVRGQEFIQVTSVAGSDAPPLLVHQYDRKPELFKAIRKRYAPPKHKK